MLEHIREGLGEWWEALEQKIEQVMAPAVEWTASSVEEIHRKLEEKNQR
jgi:hypothetical protein